jgi:hypothetical protein
MHLPDLGDMKEVVEVHRVEVVDLQHHHVIEDVVLILVLQAVLVLDLVVVVVLLVPTVVVARDPELLKEIELTVKNVHLMKEGLDQYHLPEKILNVVILVHPLLVLVKRLGIDLQPQMVVLLLLVLNQGVQHTVLNLEVPHGIKHE